MALQVSIKINGETMGDVESAIQEATRKITQGYLIGADRNETGNYSFSVDGEESEPDGDDDEPELSRCMHCDAFINPKYGADSPAVHAGHEGTEEDPRAPGDYDNICDVCNYAKGLRGGPVAR
jgi:hypothetical protein